MPLLLVSELLRFLLCCGDDPPALWRPLAEGGTGVELASSPTVPGVESAPDTQRHLDPVRGGLLSPSLALCVARGPALGTMLPGLGLEV